MDHVKYAAPKKILLAVEDPSQLEAVVGMITRIKWPAGSSVYLLGVVPEQLPVMDTRFEARTGVDEAAEIYRWRGWAATKLMTDQIARELRVRHLTVLQTEICAGSLLELAHERALQILPDVIVLGDKSGCQPGDIWFNPASTASPDVPRSVLVVRPAKPIYPLHTILAVNDSPASWQAIRFARTLSLPDWARVTMLYLSGLTDASTPGHPQDIAEPFAAKAISYLHDCGVAVRWLFRQGHPASQLLSVAQEQEANLIVMGVGESMPVTVSSQPGIAQNIVEQAPCSVLVVREQND